MTNPSPTPQSPGFISLLLRAEQALRSTTTHPEHLEAAVEQAFQAASASPSSVSSNQISALFAFKIQVAERSTNTYEAYNGIIEFGKALLSNHQLWPSTRAYIYSELARCCAALGMDSTSYEARNGYHRSLLRYVGDGAKELKQLHGGSLGNNRATLERLATTAAYSAGSIEPRSTPPDIHAAFWSALTALEELNRDANSRNAASPLQVARLLICRPNHANTSERRGEWRDKLDRLVKYTINHPFRGSLQIIITGYQHLAALSHLAKDHSNRAAAALGIAKALDNYPEHADKRDCYLALAYDSLISTGATAEAERLLARCREINFERRFNPTARLQLFAAREQFDVESGSLLHSGAVYEDLFRSVTKPTKESSAVSFRVARILFQTAPEAIIGRIVDVYALCSGTFKYKAALSHSVQLLLQSFAREDLKAPFMTKLERLRPVLPSTHQSLIAVITARRLLCSAQVEEAVEAIKDELKISPRGEENYLREDLHCLAAIARLKLGNVKYAGYHLRRVSELSGPNSDNLPKRKLLRQALEFFCAFRKGELETSAVCFGCFVGDYKSGKGSGIFSEQQLKNATTLATAIQDYLDRNMLYEVFEAAQVAAG